MAAKTKNSRSRSRWVLVGIGIVVVALIGAGSYAAFIIAAGSGEASQDIGEVAAQLDTVEGQALYRIQSETSEANFYIDEVLSGNEITVVGTTSDVGGDIRVDFSNPANSEIGEIVINARTLETDNNNRNRALRTAILNSARDEFEFITFVPTALDGLPQDAITAGTELDFQITGDLTIMDTTTEVTFDAIVLLEEDNTLSGTATLTAPYADLGVSIPFLPPIVGSVSDDVTLELVFSAISVEETE